MNVDDDGAGGVFNPASNHTGGGLCERKRRRRKMQGHTENQVSSHLYAPGDVGAVRAELFDRFAAVGGLADQRHVGFVSDRRRDTFP